MLNKIEHYFILYDEKINGYTMKYNKESLRM